MHKMLNLSVYISPDLGWVFRPQMIQICGGFPTSNNLPGFKVSLSTSDNPIKKTPYRCAQLLVFQ